MSIIKSWEDVSNTDLRYCAIHPAGNNPKEWENSGREACLEVHKIIQDNGFKVSSILEYGCGTARILKHFKDLPYSYCGVDIARPFVKECQDMGLSVYHLDDYKNKVDLVYALTVFIHLDKETGMKALQYCYDHLNDGGIALLQIPIYLNSRNPESWTHIGTWTRKELTDACRAVGFEILQLHINNRIFDYDNIGPYHSHYQILKKPIVLTL